VSNYDMAVSILFPVQDVPIAPKSSENDFWKIVSMSYKIPRIFGKTVGRWTLGLRPLC